MGPYFATVPLNRTGVEEIENGVERSGNIIPLIIPQEEYRQLWKTGVFCIINQSFGLLIDDHESERITAEQLEKVYEAINIVPGVFMKAVDLAIEHKTSLYLDF